MLTSEDRPSSLLQIRVNSPAGSDPEDVRLIVYDGQDRPVREGSGNADLTLPAGLYTIRWQYADELGEQVVRLPREGPWQLDIQRHTAAPLPGAVDAHEYYTNTSQALRNQNTGPALGSLQDGGNGSFFLFIRARNNVRYGGEDLAQDFVVTDNRANRLFDLAERSKRDPDGYLACSLPANPGLYFLEYRGARPCDFPIVIHAGWKTEIYILSDGGRPLLEGASVLLSRPEMDLEQLARIGAATDAALNALQNNTDPLPQEIERSLLYRKFENPLLGLLGLHSYLRRADARLDIARLVLFNLQDLLGNPVDLSALLFKVALRFREPGAYPVPKPVGEPPLLRASVQALLEADAAGLDAIAEGSILEHLLPYLALDSAWATWRLDSATDEFLKSPVREANKAAISRFSFGVSASPGGADNWLRNSVVDVLHMQERSGRAPDWGQIAAGLGVSRRTVNRILDDLRRPQGGNHW